MWKQRTLLGLVFGLTLAVAGTAQSLQPQRTDFRLNVQVGAMEPTLMDRLVGRTRNQGLSLKLTGNTGLATDIGVYGRFGTTAPRTAVMGSNAAVQDSTSLSYGVGLSWDFSRRGSAVVGWDSYDFRTPAGERDVRATSLGLQWRY